MDSTIAHRFVDALRRLEQTGELDPIVALFSENAELSNPVLSRPAQGAGGVRAFWEAYRKTFASITSEFRHVLVSERAAILEWSSRGESTSGHPLTYEGVSVLDLEGAQIVRFRAYFDPRSLGAQLEVKPERNAA